MTTGERIRARRKELGLSTYTLAARAGVYRCSLQRYETDKGDPSLFAAICIADVLGVSLDWLTGRTDDPQMGGRTL